MSARKVKLVIDLIRGKSTAEAEKILVFTNKAASTPVLKLLKSAVANAVHNHKMNPADLSISAIAVGQGPVLKRWRARAFGRAAPIRKPTCHINLTLSDKK